MGKLPMNSFRARWQYQSKTFLVNLYPYAVPILSNKSFRLLPQARKNAFTCTNIVRGFEQMGIWPFNPDNFDFMWKYRHEQGRGQQSVSPQSNTDVFHSPISSSEKTPTSHHQVPTSPRSLIVSTPDHERQQLISEVEALQQSLPDTPSHPLKLLAQLGDQVIWGCMQEAILSKRIREFGATEKGCSKTGDWCKVPGKSRVFNIHTLNDMRIQWNNQDREAEARREQAKNGHSRGWTRFRARPRCGVRGRGRGRAIPSPHDRMSESWDASAGDESDVDEDKEACGEVVPEDVIMGIDSLPLRLADPSSKSNKENIKYRKKQGAQTSPEQLGLGKWEHIWPARFTEGKFT